MQYWALIPLLLGVCEISRARVAENVNYNQENYLYEVQGKTFYQFQCFQKPSSKMNLATCRVVRPGVDYATFQETFKKQTAHDVSKITKKRDFESKIIASSVARQQEVEKEIAALAKDSPLLPDYQQRRLDEVNLQATHSSKMQAEEAHLAGLNELFDSKILETSFIHPIRHDVEDYSSIRRWVPYLATTFARQQGIKYGANSWFDENHNRIWFSTMKRVSAWDLQSACPRDYTPVRYSDQTADSLRVFAYSVRVGITGFELEQLPLHFWGGPAPDARRPIDLMADNLGWARSPGRGGLKTWVMMVADDEQIERGFSPFSASKMELPAGNDAKLAVLCVSSGPR